MFIKFSTNFSVQIRFQGIPLILKYKFYLVLFCISIDIGINTGIGIDTDTGIGTGTDIGIGIDLALGLALTLALALTWH